MTGTELPPSPTPPPSTTSCTGSFLVYAGIIKLELVFIGPELEGDKSVPVLQCRGWLMQVKTCSVGLARSLSLINEQEMFLEEMVEQPNTVCRELRLASVADR